jgi:hypothetical protein
LRDSLKAASPGEPLRNGHKDILAASGVGEQASMDDNRITSPRAKKLG